MNTMESQIDSESITESLGIPVDAGNENAENDPPPEISDKTEERQMTPKDSCCRICYQRNLSEPNLSLCSCKGTLELVHKSCLELWLASSRQVNCELCGYRFNLRRKPKFGVFRGILVWLKLKRSRDDRIAMALDFLKLSAALAVLFAINYQTLTLLGNIQGVDMSFQDLFTPFFEKDQNWNDLADVGSKIVRILTLAVGTPITLDFIATKMHNLDLHISHWYRWYQSQFVIELVPT